MSRRFRLFLFISLLILAGFACAPMDWAEEWGFVRPNPDMGNDLLYHDFSGRIWQDLDGDGKPDDGEDVMSGVRVELLDKDGFIVGWTTTDEDGWYDISYAFPDDITRKDEFKDHQIRVIPPEGWAFSIIPEAKDNSYNQFNTDGFSVEIDLHDSYLQGERVISGGLMPPPPPEPEPVSDEPLEEPEEPFFFSPYGYYMIEHGSGISWISYFGLFQNYQLVPVEGAEVKTILTYPDGTQQEQSATTDPMGWVEYRYEIHNYGVYQMQVDSAALEMYQYYRQYDHGVSWPIDVGPGEGPVPLMPDGLTSFYSTFNQAMIDAEFDALLDAFHPEVLIQYEEEKCRDYLEAVVENPIQVDLSAVRNFEEVWYWEIDEEQVEIPNTFTLDTTVTLPDQTQVNQQPHLALFMDDQFMPKYGWFTYCDALDEE